MQSLIGSRHGAAPDAGNDAIRPDLRKKTGLASSAMPGPPVAVN